MEPASATRDSSTSMFWRFAAPGGVEPPLDGGSDGGLRGVPFFLCSGVAVGAGLEGVGFAAGCVTGCELFKAKPGVGSKLIQP